jgi:hypothetical protein
MSYNQPYTIEVPFSGSRSVSYPKSESGGTMNVSFSGTVPAQIVIQVDTNPFDGSVSRVNGHVDALTGAVVAMNTAQVAAINKSAGDVSKAVVEGFFGTIKAELSQQLQALDSAIKASFGLIQEQGKAVSQKKEQMETDFNRISSRYVALFGDLDAECYKRIYELDKPAFQLSGNIQKKLINETTGSEGAKNFIIMGEEASSKMMLFTSSLLRKVRELIRTLGAYISQETRMTRLVDSLLADEEIGEKSALLLPVIFTESDVLEGPGADYAGHEHAEHEYASFLPDALAPEKRSTIGEAVNAYCRNDAVSRWKEPDEEDRELLDREFRLLVEAEFAEAPGESAGGVDRRRVYERLMGLWTDRSFSIL